jgi:hypothetical protein
MKNLAKIPSNQTRGIRQTLLVVFISGRRGAIRQPDGDRSTANRAVRMGVEPYINTRSMERVLANTQLLHFFPLRKHRQAHRTLAANNIFDMGFLLILPVRNLLSLTHIPMISSLAGGASVEASPAERVGRALHGEKEGVGQGGDGDHGDKSENKLKRGQVDAAWRCGKGRRWSAENGGCALHQSTGVWLFFWFLFSLFFCFVYIYIYIYKCDNQLVRLTCICGRWGSLWNFPEQ